MQQRKNTFERILNLGGVKAADIDFSSPEHRKLISDHVHAVQTEELRYGKCTYYTATVAERTQTKAVWKRETV